MCDAALCALLIDWRIATAMYQFAYSKTSKAYEHDRVPYFNAATDAKLLRWHTKGTALCARLTIKSTLSGSSNGSDRLAELALRLDSSSE